jgi:hypothetical protein
VEKKLVVHTCCARVANGCPLGFQSPKLAVHAPFREKICAKGVDLQRILVRPEPLEYNAQLSIATEGFQSLTGLSISR